MDIIPNENFPRQAGEGPLAVTVIPGKIYAWCTCGLSEKQPFCDGKHKAIDALPYQSLKVSFEEEKEVWFCQCKKTKTPPYCDGTHNCLNK